MRRDYLSAPPVRGTGWPGMGGEPSLSRPGTGPGTEGVPGLSGSESDGDGRSSPGIFSPGMGGEPSLSRPGTTEPGTSPAGAAPVPVSPGFPCARAGATDPPTRTPIKAAAAVRTIASPLTKIVTPAAGSTPRDDTGNGCARARFPGHGPPRTRQTEKPLWTGRRCRRPGGVAHRGDPGKHSRPWVSEASGAARLSPTPPTQSRQARSP